MSIAKPVVVTISHQLGKEGAKARIRHGVGKAQGQLAGYVTTIEESWVDDRLEFRLTAMGQVVNGHIDVFEDSVRVEVALPGMLGFVGRMIAARIEEQGTKLLSKPQA